MEDLLAEKKSDATADELDFIHLNKTAAMIEASLVLGGLAGGVAENAVEALRLAGRHVGLAFQIIDDVLDATADTATLGKTAGKDARADKTTYVKLHGLERSRTIAREHSDRAISAVRAFGPRAEFLAALVDSMATRLK
jgi:geranylgeranyl pyrophosphate synthase